MAADRLVIQSDSEDRTVAIGRLLGSVIGPGSVIVLEGELGSGKTRVTWGIAEGLGVDRAEVSSPTYALVHEYPAREGLRLIHADAYRMDSTDADDFETLLGVEGETDWIAMIEWGSRIIDILPENRMTVTMSHGRGTMRTIAFSADRVIIDRLRATLKRSGADE